MKKFLSLLLALSMVMALVACGSNNAGNDKPADNKPADSTQTETTTPDSGVDKGEPIEELVVWQLQTQEFGTFMIHNSESATEGPISSNCYTPLLEVNNKGILQPAAATEWGTEDGGLTWTFKLRDDIVWVDVNGNEKGKCTAQDWLTGLEWVMNFHKNSAYNTSMPSQLIVGAQEYYDYTKELDAAEAMALTPDGKFAEMVGIEATDDYTLVYHCTKNAPYFDTLATCVCLYPLAQGMIDEVGIDNVVSIDNNNMWYSGPYTITTYVQNNEKVFTPNPLYWDKDASLFKSVRITMTGDATTDDQLYETGEVDQTDLTESTLMRIYEDESHPLHKYLVEKRPRKYSYQFHWNFYKMNEDTTVDTNFNAAIANENFRQSLVYGMDLTNYWARTNGINPLSCENLAYTMKGLLYFSDGTEYVSKVVEGLGYDPNYSGDKPQRFDMDKALEYKKAAMEELAGKVTFPVEFDYYIQSGNQSALDGAVVVKEIFEALGTDYVTLNICTYISSASKEVYTPGLHSFAINGWGADYGDAENFVGQEIYGDDSAYYANRYSRINNVDEAAEPELIATYKEFTDLAVKAANIFDDLDARYQAYVDAEIYMLKHALVTPCNYNIAWQITKINDYSRSNAMYGAQNDSWKNVETRTDAYTTEEYAAIAAEYNK